jgi:integrase
MRRSTLSCSLMAWFTGFYRPLKPKLKKPKTVQGYETTIRALAKFLCARDTNRTDVGPEDLIDVNIGGLMLALGEQGRQPPTINKHRRYLLALARLACKKRFIAELPEIDKVAEFEREPECWSIEEFGRILEAAVGMPGTVGESPAGVFWPALIWADLNTGFRITALMSVRSEDVDLDQATIKVRPEYQKDRAGQTIDLLPETVEALRSLNYRHLPRVFDDWPYDRGQEQWKTLNKGLRQILARAGLPATSRDLWHKIRRTFATYIAAASDVETARVLCGHSHSRITRRYLDQRKLTRPLVANLLPRPVVARQLKLFAGPAEPTAEAG